MIRPPRYSGFPPDAPAGLEPATPVPFGERTGPCEYHLVDALLYHAVAGWDRCPLIESSLRAAFGDLERARNEARRFPSTPDAG